METVRQDHLSEGREESALDLSFLQSQVEYCGWGDKHGHQRTLHAGRGQSGVPGTAVCPCCPGPHWQFGDRSSPTGSWCRFVHTGF